MRVALASLFFCISTALPSFAQIALNPLPTRVIGQDSLTLNNLNPNLVEGREFLSPQGIALDLTTNPPGLYVSDSGNNRVLAFRSALSFSNGARADFVIGQLDLLTTLAQGPGRTTRTTGLTSPVGLAVDAAGNLYVVDGGNNRILRFPKPFAQTGDQLPDLVIGQPGFSTNSANQGGISAATLALVVGNSVLQSYLAFDSSGNLWVTDPGNNRVLRFNAKVLGSQPMPGPNADLVLGQQDFVTRTYSPLGNPLTSVSAINTPTGIAFDSGGRLFISESVSSQRGRILVWNPPFAGGQFASRIIGVDLDSPQPPAISPLQLGNGTGALFTVGNQIGIADPVNSRLLLYPSADQWTSNTLDQTASQVIGQPDFNSGARNQGLPGPTAATLATPIAAAFSGSELYVADASNNRVLVLPQAGSSFGAATRVLGQDAFTLNAPNLIEGREFDFAASNGAFDTGMAVDLGSSPPHLYVADTYNNRILGFNDLRNLQPGAKADIVIGQPDFQHQWINYPSNNTNTPNQSGLNIPTGLLVDSSGNLYVADTGNSRVLRFPAPFANYTPGTPEPADLVLGQSSFFFTITDPTNRTMAAPYGLAMTNFPGLLVSDIAQNRVLFFQGPTYSNGQTATRVFGQADFNSSAAGSSMNQLSAPHHVAVDSDDRLYVADSGNGRVMIFDHAPNAATYPQAAYALTNASGLVSPRGMYVSPVNGDIWVADAGASNGGAAIRFPAYNALEVNGFQPNATLAEFSPRAVTEDAWGNVFVADAANRVVIHYPGLSSLNAASYLLPNVLAPGMIAAMYSTGNFMQFGTTSASFSKLPLPTQLNGLEVLFNGSPAPLFAVSPNQINFQVPNGAPQSGTADLQVLEAATGRVLGDSTVLMNAVDPGVFTQAANGSGAASAVNMDGTVNSQSNPATSGQYISLYLTGLGYVPGAPPDGQAPTGAVPAPRAPTVFIQPETITGSAIQYSGLAPGLVGVWQINVQIPSDIPTTMPNQPTWVIVQQASALSGGPTVGRGVEIYVKHP
jgi:uncharacterized protein (TIGR03437 family)